MGDEFVGWMPSLHDTADSSAGDASEVPSWGQGRAPARPARPARL